MPLVACCRYCGSDLGGEHLSLCPMWVAGYERVIVVDGRWMTAKESMALAGPLRARARQEAGVEEV